MSLGPDDHNCRRCGEPVRYAELKYRRMSVSFDAVRVPNGGYTLVEEEIGGEPTGKWIATYTKVADRPAGQFGYRQHSCPPRESA